MAKLPRLININSLTSASIFILLFGMVLCNPRTDAFDTGVSHDAKEIFAKFAMDLLNAGKQAREAFKEFLGALRDMTPKFQSTLYSGIDNLKDKVEQIKGLVQNKIKSSGAAATQCFETFSSKANAIVGMAASKAVECANKRINDILLLITYLTEETQYGHELVTNALHEMKNCTAQSSNAVKTGVCLGSVALKTRVQMEAVKAKCSFTMAHIRLGMMQLPAAVELCAAVEIIEGARESVSLAADMGRCSATSAFSVLTGNKPATAPSTAPVTAPVKVSASASSPATASETAPGSTPETAPASAPETAPEIVTATAPLTAPVSDTIASYLLKKRL